MFRHISDQFALETAATSVEDSALWTLGVGSDDDAATFVAVGNSTEVQIAAGGTVRLLRTDTPESSNQRAEIRFAFADPAVTGWVGVILRYVDVDNYLLARVSHSATPSLTLIERIAGADSTLATVLSPGSAPGGAIRLEVVGARARLWYEPAARDVTDRPPDAAVALASGGDEATAYGWGMYLECAGANTMSVERFHAADLPDVVQPAPYVTVAGAPDYAMSTITATVTGISTLAWPYDWLEWEIYPAERQDLPEAYRDIADVSLTTRVFLVRSGYTYDVRVRGISTDGSASVWTAMERVTATGTQTLPTAFTMPTETFPDITPDYVLDREQTSDVASHESETGRERTAWRGVRPRNTFSLVFENREDAEAQSLIDFFDRMQGQNLPFQWTHPITGDVYAMRFAGDDYNADSADILWSGSFDIVECATGVDSEITLVLEVDPSLLPAGSGSGS